MRLDEVDKLVWTDEKLSYYMDNMSSYNVTPQGLQEVANALEKGEPAEVCASDYVRLFEIYDEDSLVGEMTATLNDNLHCDGDAEQIDIAVWVHGNNYAEDAIKSFVREHAKYDETIVCVKKDNMYRDKMKRIMEKCDFTFAYFDGENDNYFYRKTI